MNKQQNEKYYTDIEYKEFLSNVSMLLEFNKYQMETLQTYMDNVENFGYQNLKSFNVTCSEFCDNDELDVFSFYQELEFCCPEIMSIIYKIHDEKIYTQEVDGFIDDFLLPFYDQDAYSFYWDFFDEGRQERMTRAEMVEKFIDDNDYFDEDFYLLNDKLDILVVG